MDKDFPIYVGYDAREDIAYKVCEYSIYKHSDYARVIPLNQDNLREQGHYWRDADPLSSTAFTFTRFLVPALQNYEGWAVFCDCDFVWTEDVEKLFDQLDDRYAVMVVKHEHTPPEGIKMDGCKQTQYPRKNWSSLILWNCAHPSNAKLTKELVNAESGQYLHRFSWLEDHEIGNLNPEWNWLVGWNKEPQNGHPKVYHWTEGGPWFSNYRDCEYKDVWWDYLIDYANAMSAAHPSVPRQQITWVTTLSRDYYNRIGHTTLPTWENLPGQVVFVWDDKPIDLGFGQHFNFWREVAAPNDPWMTEGMGSAKADRFWKKSRVQVWAARRYTGLVIWIDTDISVRQKLTTDKAKQLLHPGDKIWATLDAGDPLDLETGLVSFNTNHERFEQFISAYSVGWYNGEIYRVRQPYDNHMIGSLKHRFPHKTLCPHHSVWGVTLEEQKNEYCIKHSELDQYFEHHIGILNKEEKAKKVERLDKIKEKKKK